MSKNTFIKNGLWKFIFWPVVWITVFWSASIISEGCGSSDRLGLWSVFAGAAMLVWAFAIHIVAGKTLKKMGHTTGHKSIWPNRLVVNGIYSCMRHPQHLGLSMIPAGIALLAGSLTAVAAAGWAIMAALWFVLIIEEPECQGKFGAEYFRYMQTTPPFSLNFKCLVKGWRALKNN
jgi:protein-S-isoprenylcysteine O-methyltransferase Ste14